MTRIAVSADDQLGLGSAVNPHFGRCPFFVLVDVENKTITAHQVVANPFFGKHEPGQVPGFVHEQGASVMLTGGMGGRAVQFFTQFGIEPVTGASGSVRQAVSRYLAGALQGAEPCRESVEHGHGSAAETSTPYEKDQVGRLQEEATDVQKRLDEVTARLRKLRAE